MTTKHRYRALCTRDDGAWIIGVPDLPRVHTWAPDLRRASAHAAEAIAVWLDVALDEIDVDLTVA